MSDLPTEPPTELPAEPPAEETVLATTPEPEAATGPTPDALAEEARTNRLTATALLATSALALLLILAGLITALAAGERTARPVALADLTSQHGAGPLLLGLGLLALSAAPALGILVTVARWLRTGDRRHALLAALVVALLLGGALLG
ncbi:hypothetical protein HS99_0016420 [Kitasatospora aureofaciens]|uniref:DUF1634 domain-containing protein n=1 Tax=Kitasatospora aureofaciens TaxID=1894 RepID=A0A1E7MV47_KITAU|nr:DUF1634 domain-containing protein [Kitasatospora aureofaciens]OEV32295.1 hypothetical protein HS99_0016420 [Kitasatospora aureofaciens]